jgi:isoleucyl-tRNA synthetase
VDPTLTPELKQEGLAREVVNRVQKLRKDSGLEVADRIRLGVLGPSELVVAVERFRDFVAGETLAVEIVADSLTGEEAENAARLKGYEHIREVEMDGVTATIALSRATPTPAK